MNKISLLVIGNDASLLNINSASSKRAKSYAGLVERYDTLTLANNDAVIQLADNASVYGVKKSNRFITYFNLIKIALKKIKTTNYTIISAQDPFEFGLLACVLSKINNCKFHLQEHGDFFGTGNKYWLKESWFNGLRNVLGRILLPRADGIRVVSQRIKGSLINIGVDERKISVVPIIEKREALTFEHINNQDLNVIFVGRLVKAKNIPMILRAIQACCLTNDFAGNFYFIGEGEEKNFIDKFINKNNLGARVKLINWTNQLENYYSIAKIIVLTSWHEGWGRVVVDAGAYGVVPIMTKVGCAEELIIDKYNGLLVDFNDHHQLAEKIIYLSQNKDELEKMSVNIKNDVNVLMTNYDLKQKMFVSWQKTINA